MKVLKRNYPVFLMHVKYYSGREVVQWIHECTDFSGQEALLGNLI